MHLQLDTRFSGDHLHGIRIDKGSGVPKGLKTKVGKRDNFNFVFANDTLHPPPPFLHFFPLMWPTPGVRVPHLHGQHPPRCR